MQLPEGLEDSPFNVNLVGLPSCNLQITNEKRHTLTQHNDGIHLKIQSFYKNVPQPILWTFRYSWSTREQVSTSFCHVHYCWHMTHLFHRYRRLLLECICLYFIVIYLLITKTVFKNMYCEEWRFFSNLCSLSVVNGQSSKLWIVTF